MERAGTLINRLLEQYQQNATAETLALTTQLLLAELQQAARATSASTRKVSVMMPLSVQHLNTPMVKETTVLAVEEKAPVEIPQQEEAPTIPEEVSNVFTSAIMKDIPTLTYQKNYKPELNETITNCAESLNDKLKLNKTELGAVLHESPVRDLRKAIGINDRYLFINELFRGDEASYERSIKTINAFNILAEAEYWIKRELKLKFAWPEENETVRLFDQLVKRRFA